jgi:hypothetical protein
LEDRSGRTPIEADSELGKTLQKIIDMDEREHETPEQPAFMCARCRKPGHRRRYTSDAKSECRNRDCKFSKGRLDK